MKILKKNDVFLILGLVIVAGLLFFLMLKIEKKANFVTIMWKNQPYAHVQLSQDQEIEVVDEKGNNINTIIIQQSSVRMKEADCPDKLCLRQGAISRFPQNIVCLPNQVVVEVDFDAALAPETSGEDAVGWWDIDAIVK